MSVPDAGMEFQLILNRCEDLFAEPEADPFNPNTRFQSGIDELVAKVRLHVRELDHKTRIIIRLPQSEIGENTESDTRAALDRYCAANIALNQQVIDNLRVSNGWYTITAAIVGLALLMAAGVLVNFMPPQFGGAIAGIVGIAIWVVMWDPFYNYFYAWRPNRLDIRVLSNLQNAELVLEAA